MALKSDVGAKFDKGKKQRILALSFGLTDEDLADVIQKLLQLQEERNQKLSSDKIDTISC